MKKQFKVLLILSVLLLLCACTSCQKNDPSYSAGDGNFHVELSRLKDDDGREYSDEEMQGVVSSARSVYDRSFMLLSSDSAVMSKINSDVDVILDCDAEILNVLRQSVKLSDQTNGIFQPCGGAYTRLFDGGASPDEAAVTDALTHVGTDKFEISDTSIKKLDRLAAFDLSTVDKAYALQKSAESLEAEGAKYGILSADGATAVFGSKSEGADFNIAVPGDNGYLGWFCIPRGYVAYVDKDTKVYDFGVGTNEFKRVAVYAGDGITAAAVANAVWIGGAEYEAELEKSLGGTYCMVAEKADGTTVTSAGAVESGRFVFHTAD